MRNKIELFMKNLKITEEEAIDLIKFDEEVDRMSMSEVESDIKVKKYEEDNMQKSFTETQLKVLDILGASSGDALTATEISNLSGGEIHSRGLGSVMRKLIELNLVDKIDGRPVKYKGRD